VSAACRTGCTTTAASAVNNFNDDTNDSDDEDGSAGQYQEKEEEEGKNAELTPPIKPPFCNHSNSLLPNLDVTMQNWC
jgi:hypothetical protein